MIKRIVKLFQIARKLSTSGAVNTISEIHTLPVSLNIFNIMSIGPKIQIKLTKKSLREKNYVWLYKAWELHL